MTWTEMIAADLREKGTDPRCILHMDSAGVGDGLDVEEAG